MYTANTIILDKRHVALLHVQPKSRGLPGQGLLQGRPAGHVSFSHSHKVTKMSEY